MPDYKKMYFALFNAVTTAVDELQSAQRKGEEAYIESDDMPLPISSEAAEEKLKKKTV